MLTFGTGTQHEEDTLYFINIEIPLKGKNKMDVNVLYTYTN